jgi:hypothetical protein
VDWSAQAERDLALVVPDPSVRAELRCNAERTLHEIKASAGDDRRADEGIAGEIMWHRGWTHEQELYWWLPEQADDGPWNYVLFYRKAAGLAEFVVLAVRSRRQIAERVWEQLRDGS